MKQRLKPATGPGSMNCENEIRALIDAGKRDEALKLYRANERVVYRAGHNPGIPRLSYWYHLAIQGDPRAA